jgi:oxygen-dependent protoporphyrinogen oxidase
VLRLPGDERIAAREVILAIPARAQAALLGASNPHIAEMLGTISYAPILVASVGFARTAQVAAPEGFGFLRGRGSGARILGATFNARLNPEAVAPPEHELLTVFLGGTEDEEALGLRDDEVRDIVLRDLQTALGGPVRPDLFDVWRWPRAIPLPSNGHRGRMARAAAALDAGRIRLLGSHATGVSLNDCCRPLAPLARPLPEGAVRV